MSAEPEEFEVDSTAQDLAAPGLPGEARVDGAGTPAAYWRAFSLVTFTINRFIVDHVLRAARHFAGRLRQRSSAANTQLSR